MATTAQRTRVIGYVRVSTTEQADHGVSLDAQRARLTAYAAALDLDLVAVEADAGASAKSLDRPALQAALARLELGEADGLLVAKLDRLTRSVRDLGDLLDAARFGGAWQLLSVGDSIDTRSAAGRLMLNVLASVSQWEREANSERTRAAMAHLRAQGVRVGTVPLGSRLVGHRADGRAVLAADPTEQQTIARIRELRADGLTLRAIAKQLHAEGRAPKSGDTWHASAIRNVLARA